MVMGATDTLDGFFLTLSSVTVMGGLRDPWIPLIRLVDFRCDLGEFEYLYVNGYNFLSSRGSAIFPGIKFPPPGQCWESAKWRYPG